MFKYLNMALLQIKLTSMSNMRISNHLPLVLFLALFLAYQQ